jgi:hypothetical protein
LLRRERLALERRIRQTSLAGTLFWLLQTAKDLPNSELALDLKNPWFKCGIGTVFGKENRITVMSTKNVTLEFLPNARREVGQFEVYEYEKM